MESNAQISSCHIPSQTAILLSFFFIMIETLRQLTSNYYARVTALAKAAPWQLVIKEPELQLLWLTHYAKTAHLSLSSTMIILIFIGMWTAFRTNIALLIREIPPCL